MDYRLTAQIYFKNRNKIELSLFLFLTIFSFQLYGLPPQVASYDIVVYGGSSAGIIAAVQAANMGKLVAVIEPTRHIGGMTRNGLGWVDIKNPQAIGGRTREYFHHVWEYYQKKSSWTWEDPHPIKGQLVNIPEDELLWVVEPHVAEKIFRTMTQAAKIPIAIVYHERLNRQNGVRMDGQKIVQIIMESGRKFNAKMFIDATYEGDLMAASKVSYIVGREANKQYYETLNGVRTNLFSKKTSVKIDPYIIKGDPTSGLLPRVNFIKEECHGQADRGVQAYNYRMCLTDVPKNRIQIEKPQGYDELEYELIFRAIQSGVNRNDFFSLHRIPNRKTDSNNNGFISTDYVGMSSDYPEADYKTRALIAKAHEQWQRGLIWTLQNHPRVPQKIRDYYAPWGLAKDEFSDNNHWPYMLYVREARRMISSIVIDEQAVLGQTQVDDSIGLAAYEMDSHAIKYTIGDLGFIESEGCFFHPVHTPYQISYQAIIPKRHECQNLLVPICLSASHVAYGSIRMEPTFMILGESAGTAASLAIDLDLPLQNLPYKILRHQLLVNQQVLDSNNKIKIQSNINKN